MNISVILPARGETKSLVSTLDSIVINTLRPQDIEVICSVDSNDDILVPELDGLSHVYKNINLRFEVVEQSEHFTKDYWNFMAKKSSGRFILPIASDCKILTSNWDDILYGKMDSVAKNVGDDIVHGLIRDNIKRYGEDPKYPNFSCHPVLSREHISAIGYFFDERYWSWGADQAVTYLYRELNVIMNEFRLVSLTDIKIFAFNSMHTTDETDPVKLDAMREADKGYQKHLRISQSHPCSLTTEEYRVEAQKLKTYIDNKRSTNGANG